MLSVLNASKRLTVTLCLSALFGLATQTCSESQALLFAQEQSSVQQWIERSEALNLSESQYWKNLLFYRRGWLWGEQGIFVSPGFYLSPNGRKDPRAELTSTIEQMFRPIKDFSDLNLHPQCRFPARFHWLKEQLGDVSQAFPKVDCVEYRRATERIDADRVSMIFSSYFVNNPASMFGHTFLRLHKRLEPGSTQASLLDKAINFSAQVDEADTSTNYAWKGLFGGYPGKFGVGPFYFKVQEYANHESRDLWGFELGLTESELTMMLRSLWEVEGHEIDYFYLDHNCSLAILMLLQNARPGWNPSQEVRAWVIPSDTLRLAVSAPMSVRSIHFLPSALSRFEFRLQDLNDEESTEVREWLDAKTTEERRVIYERLPPSSRRRVMDAVLELIDFKEGLAGDSAGKKYRVHRSDALQRRAAIAEKSPPIRMQPEQRRPDLGHRPHFLGLGLGQDRIQSTATNFLELHWRPALHDSLALSQGYVPGYSLHFFDLKLRYRDHQLFVSEWHPLMIETLNNVREFNRPLSWKLDSFYIDDHSCEQRSRPDCRLAGLSVGGGLAWRWFERFSLYAMILPKLGQTFGHKSRGFLEATADAGTTLDIRKHWRLSASGSIGRRYIDSQVVDLYQSNARTSVNLSSQSELRFGWQRQNPNKNEFSAESILYW